MSVTALRPRETVHDGADPQATKPASEPVTPKEPDFSSSVFAAVHLPTGLLTGSARPTPATLAKDWAALRSHVAAVSADLRSPELAAALKADARVYASYVFFNACFLPLAKAAFVDAGPARIMSSAIAIVALWKGIPAAIADMKASHARAVDANVKAHPALHKLLHDVAAMEESAIRLAADTKQLGGAP